MNYLLRKRIVQTLIALCLFVGVSALIGMPSLVLAQPESPCELLGGCSTELLENADGETVQDGITGVILTVIRTLIFISMTIAVLFVVIGGLQMVTSNGEADKFKKGRETAINALIGFVVAVISISVVTLVGNLLQGDLFGAGSTTPSQEQTTTPTIQI